MQLQAKADPSAISRFRACVCKCFAEETVARCSYNPKLTLSRFPIEAICLQMLRRRDAMVAAASALHENTHQVPRIQLSTSSSAT